MLGANRRFVCVLALAAFVVASPSLLSACKRTESDKTAVVSVSDDKHVIVRLDANASGDLADIVRGEAKKARARGLRPFVELRADWCGPCRKLEASESDPRIRAAFDGTYLVRVDVDDWGGRLGAYAVSAIPAFLEVDDEGKPTGRRLDGGAWKNDVPAEMAPPLGAFFRAKPLSSAR